VPWAFRRAVPSDTHHCLICAMPLGEGHIHKSHFALRAAIIANDLGAMQMVLSAPGMDINAQDNAGFTALMVAVIHCKPDAVKLLLGLGADKTLVTCKISPWHRRGTTKEDLASFEPMGAHDYAKQYLPDGSGITELLA